MFDNEESVHAGAGALSFVLNDQRVMTTTGMGLLGFLFYLVLVVALVTSAS